MKVIETEIEGLKRTKARINFFRMGWGYDEPPVLLNDCVA